MKEIEEFYNRLLKIKYGWHDKEGRLHPKIEPQIFAREYKMQPYNKIEESGYAICWELCELERHFFNKHKIENHTIMAVIKNKKGGSPCHTFTTIKVDDQMYWFEASWEGQKGIRKFSDIENLKDYFRLNFQDFTKNPYDPDAIEFYEYRKPLFCYNCYLFYINAYTGNRI